MGFWLPQTQDFHEAQIEYLRRLTENLRLEPNQTVLDVGGGQAGTAIWLCQTYDVNVVVVDIVEAMIAKGRDRVAEAGLEDRIELCHADVLHFRTDRRFDHILAVEAALHVRDQRQLFQYCHDRLEPGGGIAFSTYWYEANWPWLTDLYLSLTVGDRGIPSLVDYQRGVRSASFEQIHVRDVTADVLPRSTEELSKEPYLTRIKDYHREHYGRVVTLGLPLFLRYHERVIERGKLHCIFLEASKAREPAIDLNVPAGQQADSEPGSVRAH
jgi:ubiquinone/menaquinone biosynthesis C-methylase UbiE